MSVLRIKNWSKFQHFKDRRPPWVKLYRDLLDDVEWFELDPIAAKALVMIWLIASEDDGLVPDNKKLAFRLRMSVHDVEQCIAKLSHWLEPVCINVISARYQDDAPETETETETEDMAKTGGADSSPSSPQAGANGVQTSQPDDCPHREIIALFHEVLPSVRHVRDWTPARQTMLKARWREDSRRQNLEWWRRFFGYVGESDFLMGRKSSNNRRPFELGLEWLVKAENFAKVREGAYHEMQRETA